MRTRASSPSWGGWGFSVRRVPAVRAETLAPAGARQTGRLWLAALVPLVLLGGLLWLIVQNGPGEALRGDNVPPVERLAFGRVTLDERGIHANLLNDGPDPVTIAQVAVDDALW